MEGFQPSSLHKSLGPIADDLNHSISPVMRLYGAVAGALASQDFASISAEARERQDAEDIHAAIE